MLGVLSLQSVRDIILGWPMIFYVIAAGVACTVAFRFIQLRYFTRAWRYTFKSESQTQHGDMTPLQAFISTLNANIGNGSVAGMATAIYSGGPGAAFWVAAIGMLLMSVRFAEVYLGVYFGAQAPRRGGLGGPMLYLKQVIGGYYLAYAYALACFVFSLLGGSAMQTNSIRISITSAWAVSPFIIACVLLLFTAYIVWGGAPRIVKAAEKIIPIKVGGFFIVTLIVLVYHWQALPGALALIVNSALRPQALMGGMFGFTVQQAMRFGIFRSIMATEAGLGTAAIFFGSTGSVHPFKDSVMAMLSTFVSTVACFLVSLCIVASGVWNSGLTSTALTSAAYQTVFGPVGGWIMAFLSVSFGIGVLVVYAYLASECWLFLTKGRYVTAFNVLYCLSAFMGALIGVDLLWTIYDMSNAVILFINLFGILALIPFIRHRLQTVEEKQ